MITFLANGTWTQMWEDEEEAEYGTFLCIKFSCFCWDKSEAWCARLYVKKLWFHSANSAVEAIIQAKFRSDTRENNGSGGLNEWAWRIWITLLLFFSSPISYPLLNTDYGNFSKVWPHSELSFKHELVAILPGRNGEANNKTCVQQNDLCDHLSLQKRGL